MESAQVGAELESDPRWRRLHDRSWVCPCCGETHAGLFDLACDHPAPWPEGQARSPNSIVSTSNHFLSEDFCVLNGESHFARCVLELPILGSNGARFGYGVWSSLAKKNFDIYVENFDNAERGELGPWFGWFSNQLVGYRNTVGLKCKVHPRRGRQRPWIELERTDHPLALEQRNGITFDRVLEIYTINGHDLRGALTD
jgi:hypothetical protein